MLNINLLLNIVLNMFLKNISASIYKNPFVGLVMNGSRKTRRQKYSVQVHMH